MSPVFFCPRSPTPFSLPLLASLAVERVQWQYLSDRASKKKEERGEFKQNGFRNDMFAFGKAVVELLGGKLLLYDDEVEGAKTKNKGMRNKQVAR